MANQIKAPINYPVIAGGKIVAGGSVLFGQPNVKPDEDNPSTLKAVYLDAALTQPAQNPQGLSSDGVFDQSDTGILFGSNDTVYSIVIKGANKKELSYIPEYDLSDANAAATAQDAASAAASSEANALSFKNLTEALYTDFTNRYFGAFSSDPSVDDLGNPPNEGSIYFNSTSNVFFTWTDDAWVNQFPSNPNGLLVTATGTTTPRTLANREADVLTVSDGIGIIGDGVTDDTAAVLAIDADTASSNLINLEGLTLAVTSLPTKKFFYNGFWLIDGFTLDATDTSGIISNSTDTGGLETAYTGGANNTPTVKGNSTKDQRILVGSNNCRAQFPRSGNYTSIYSWSYGNVSANVAARQSVAGAPQAVNTASEECEVYGFRGLNGASIFSEVVASTGANIATRLGSANATYSANIASNTSFVGGGRRARLEPVVVGGVVTDITIIDGGTGYDPLLDELRIVDRSSVHTIDATATYTVDSNGTIDSITMTNGGAGYIEDITRTVSYILCSGENQGNFATELSKVSKGDNSGNLATIGCETEGSESSCIASSSSNALGSTRSVVLASTGSNSNASGGVVISGNIVDADNDGAVVMGRRVKSANARSFVLGDAASGSALTANRKIELTAGGNVNAAGALTPSVVFTDYGEYFENLELGEIPLGSIITLKGDKVLPAKSGDDILGVVSATACIRAGDSWNHWAGRYKLSEYGDVLMEEVDMVKFNVGCKEFDGKLSDFDSIPDDATFYKESLPIENENYNPSLGNTPRSERPNEWTLVGMLGQVYTNVSKDCVAGDYVNELGSPSKIKTKLKIMKITSKKDGFNIAKCLLN